MLRMIVLAFALLLPAHALAQCLGDFDGDGTVRVNELVVAVNNALRGCNPTPTQGEEPTATPASNHSLTPTPSPTNNAQRGPDLLVVEIASDHVPGPCQGPFAYVSVCIKNDGDVSAGAFDVAIAEVVVSVDGLTAGETQCLRGPPLTNGPRFIVATVDPVNVVAESNETNNVASGEAPFPTVRATCRPTATATPSPPSASAPFQNPL